MNRALVLLFAFVMMVTCLPTGDNVPPGDAPPSRGRIIFQDEFDFFDPNKWQHLVTAWRGGNDEFQYYADRGENSYVRDGILYIKPTLTADTYGEDFLYHGTLDLRPNCNIDIDGGCYRVAGDEIINPIQSARIRTINSFSFVYGTVEIRAKMPRGDWIWPAMWLLPTSEVYGGWPRSGEIDMVEIRGNNNLRSANGKIIGNSMVASTNHWGTDYAHNQWPLTHYEKILAQGDFSSDFHTFGLERRPDVMRFFVDGNLVGEIRPPAGGFWELGNFASNPGGPNIWASGSNMAPFDQPFHFIFNVAVGGNYFPEGCVNEGYQKPWKMYDPRQMRAFWENRDKWLPTWNAQTEDNALKVEYIRVWEL